MPRAKKQHLKRQKNGQFYCKFKGKMFAGSTEDEAFAKREEYKRLLQLGLAAEQNPVIGEYIPRWMKLYKSGVTSKCYNDYANLFEALAPIAGKHFQEVTLDDVRQVWLHFNGYSESTIHRARMLYLSLFDTAVENGFCVKNPFRSKHAQPARGTSGTHRIITDEERELIHSTPHRFRLGVLVMLYAGLRKGEALAIDLDRDVDLAAGVLHVRQAVRIESNQPITVSPKTAAGVRDIPIFPVLAEELRGQHGWLIPSASGKQASGSAFARGWASYMTALSRAAGHPVSIRCHDLRHSFCTMLRKSGVEMKVAMMWMGHADEKMILRVYDHVTPDRIEENAQRVIERMKSAS